MFTLGVSIGNRFSIFTAATRLAAVFAAKFRVISNTENNVVSDRHIHISVN